MTARPAAPKFLKTPFPGSERIIRHVNEWTADGSLHGIALSSSGVWVQCRLRAIGQGAIVEWEEWEAAIKVPGVYRFG